MRKKAGINAQLRYTFLIVALIPVTVIGAIFMALDMQYFIGSVKKDGVNQAAKVALQSGLFFEEAKTRLFSLTDILSIHPHTESEVQEFFQDMLASSETFAELSLLDSAGKERVRAGYVQIFTKADLRDFAGASFFHRIMRENRPVTGGVGVISHTGEPYLQIALPITSPDRKSVHQVLLAHVRMKHVWQIVERAKAIDRFNSAYLLDETGHVVAHNNPSVVLKGITLRRPKHQDTALNDNGVRVLYTTHPLAVGERIFTVVVEQKYSEVLLPVVYRGGLFAGFILLIFAVGRLFLAISHKKILEPVEYLADVANRIRQGNFDLKAGLSQQDEIGHLSETFDSMTTRMQQLISELSSEVEERRRIESEMMQLNTELEERVAREIDTRRRQEQLMVQQAKLASMGEMIGAIAHQWRQPLNALGLIVQDLQDAWEYGEVTEEYVRQTVQNAMQQVQFMSSTIDDFRNFFVPAKEMKQFYLKHALCEVLTILSGVMKNANVDVYVTSTKDLKSCTVNCHIAADWTSFCKFDISGESVVEGYPNEFKQVIVNLIKNSMDAIQDQRLKTGEPFQGQIAIRFTVEDDIALLELEDNGGGIPETILDRIFEPYYTTKEQGKGTGIGLYMSKVIIENNMKGHIHARNGEKGAVFSIRLHCLIPEEMQPNYVI